MSVIHLSAQVMAAQLSLSSREIRPRARYIWEGIEGLFGSFNPFFQHQRVATSTLITRVLSSNVALKYNNWPLKIQRGSLPLLFASWRAGNYWLLPHLLWSISILLVIWDALFSSRIFKVFFASDPLGWVWVDFLTYVCNVAEYIQSGY